MLTDPVTERTRNRQSGRVRSHREGIKRELDGRLRRYLAGEPGAAADPDGLETALAGVTEAGSPDYIDVMTLLGSLRLCREGLLRPGQAPPDIREVARLLAPVTQSAPSTFTTLLLITVQAIAGLPGYDRPERLGGKALNLADHGMSRGDPAVLRQAIDLFEQALAAATIDHPSRGDLLTSACSCWISMYELTRDPAAVDEAVRTGLAAAELTAGESHGTALNNLGAALRLRHDLTGDPGDLDRAIELFERAIPRTPRDHVEWPVRNHNLGYALGLRYHAAGRHQDLDRAIDSVRKAAEAVGPHRPQRAEYIGDLAYFHWLRHQATGDRADVAQAARLFEVVATTSPDPERRDMAAQYLRAAQDALR
ncbi:hypothetical protein SAMN05421835_104250 [Amycolatopsis sacchari]|uniref:Tetratricopeptide repeat-containing protein n=1 Tax=Amycolatopsis sacchari TaxID=115433 RepID=A0A1I3Q9G2_9PSEU|nr:hypothetical protein SAMN05421835_104250 [Amycolatopsis sacchari]